MRNYVRNSCVWEPLLCLCTSIKMRETHPSFVCCFVRVCAHTRISQKYSLTIELYNSYLFFASKSISKHYLKSLPKLKYRTLLEYFSSHRFLNQLLKFSHLDLGALTPHLATRLALQEAGF
jgi:predicted transcriptional regulator